MEEKKTFSARFPFLSLYSLWSAQTENHCANTDELHPSLLCIHTCDVIRLTLTYFYRQNLGEILYTALSIIHLLSSASYVDSLSSSSSIILTRLEHVLAKLERKQEKLTAEEESIPERSVGKKYGSDIKTDESS